MNWKNQLILLWLSSVYCFGLYFFCRGFLLNRQSLPMKSSCLDVQHPQPNQGGVEGCWVPARFKRMVLIVIDALRYDLIAPQFSESEVNRNYHNHLTTVRRLLEEEPGNSLLYKFIADAPTTTLQRLKGLTTGSLPTFIDAGSNFAGSEIVEDNIVSQLLERQKEMVFLGDDTWESIYPNKFKRSYPFPSFDVMDLHTVDNGVLRHLFDELKEKKDWGVLIAHFLGVDHCGHKYGPNHPEMTKKLKQMDAMLKL